MPTILSRFVWGLHVSLAPLQYHVVLPKLSSALRGISLQAARYSKTSLTMCITFPWQVVHFWKPTRI